MPSTPNPPSPLPRPQPHVPAASAELADALARSFDVPLRAMRASLENLSHTLAPSDQRVGTLTGLLDQVRRLASNVQELVDYAQPTTPHPVLCTQQEIARTAVGLLPDADARERVQIACDSSGSQHRLPAALLTRTLARLLNNATEAGSGPVLLSIRSTPDDSGLRCTIINVARSGVVAELRAPFASSKTNRLGLGLTLAERDMELLGGRLTTASTTGSITVVTAEIPAALVRTEKLVA